MPSNSRHSMCDELYTTCVTRANDAGACRLLGSAHGRATQGGNGGHLEDTPDAGGDRGGFCARNPPDEPRTGVPAQRGRRIGRRRRRPSATRATARGSPGAGDRCTDRRQPRRRRPGVVTADPVGRDLERVRRLRHAGRSSPSRAAQSCCWRWEREPCSSRRATGGSRCRSVPLQRGVERAARAALSACLDSAWMRYASTERRRSRTDRAVGYTTAQVLKTCWATGPMPLRRLSVPPGAGRLRRGDLGLRRPCAWRALSSFARQRASAAA